MQDKKYWIWLSLLSSKIRLEIIHKLLKKFKAQQIWKLDKKALQYIGCTKYEISQITNIEYRQNIENYAYYMEKNNIKIITYEDKGYPQKLKNIYDPPVVLYAKGNLELLNCKSIGIVGCRLCSENGKSIAKNLAFELSKNNLVIVSGLAKGIDAWAHIGCINAKGKTIAVLGTGVDVIYPMENKGLYNKIEKTGLLISEYIVGRKAIPANFPRRNRIISGISNGILVVEAKNRSGSLITADLALEQGKEVYAVPGNIYSHNSEGTNNLIKQGAKLVTEAKDILDY